MMLKKEREVIFLLEKHLDEIKEWLKISSEALSFYLSDDLEKIKYIFLISITGKDHTSMTAWKVFRSFLPGPTKQKTKSN
jgi:hypothetical protein